MKLTTHIFLRKIIEHFIFFPYINFSIPQISLTIEFIANKKSIYIVNLIYIHNGFYPNKTDVSSSPKSISKTFNYLPTYTHRMRPNPLIKCVSFGQWILSIFSYKYSYIIISCSFNNHNNILLLSTKVIRFTIPFSYYPHLTVM